MKLKPLVFNLVIVIISLCAGLLLCEVAARWVLNPADYLSVSMVEHEILGRSIAPGTAGFDDWGFRNRSVPGKVDVVAIGDSHTYGNTAKMDESWPYVLGRLTGKSVYNMGLGGYGPNQYYHLLETRARALKPGIVLCGLYMGDDFENAFTVTYGLDAWSYMRQSRFEGVDPDIWRAPDDSVWMKDARVWLSQHSILYQIVFHGPILGKIKGNFRIGSATASQDPLTSTLVLDGENIREAFRPSGIRDRLDQKRESIREGMRITMRLLKDMNESCRKNGSQFVVVIIPTKEMVFADYLEHNAKVHLGDVIDDLLANERIARKDLFEFCRTSGIRCVDTLPALKRSIRNELYVRSDRDMHPNKNGYSVIADAVNQYMKNADLLH
jgi:hypothetical protein